MCIFKEKGSIKGSFSLVSNFISQKQILISETKILISSIYIYIYIYILELVEYRIIYIFGPSNMRSVSFFAHKIKM
jgi:hypothetical protein